MAFCAVIAVVAGLLITRNGTEGSQGSHEAVARPTRNQTPFDQALANLATARLLHYQDTAAGGTRRDITVTPSGTLFGSMGDGGRGLDQDVLRIDGTTYTRGKKADPYENPDGEPQDPDAPGTWTLADRGNSPTLNPVLAQFLSPAELAVELWDAVDELKTLPDPDDPDLRAEEVHGVPALRADTPAGSLLITRNKPYRVVRLEPYDVSGRSTGRHNHVHKGASPSARPRVTTGPLDGDSQGMDLFPMSGDQADAAYDTLEADTKQLVDAVDRGVEFTLSTTDGNVSCGTDGCTVHQSFTGQLTSAAKTRVTDGRVSAVMRATVTIDGRYAGGCTSSQSTFPLTGDTVSGMLSCSDPEAGAVFAAVNAACKSQTEAEPRASSWRPASCHFLYVATPVVNAAALAVGEVSKLVKQVQRERHAGECSTRKNGGNSEDDPRSFPDLIPDDKPERLKPIAPGTALSRPGTYAYVVRENGKLVVGTRTAGHLSLIRGDRVLAAGQFKTNGGEVVYLDNKSGHYRPYGVHAEKAAVSAFHRNGLGAGGKYIAAWGRPGC
ncbi:hypothetical protein ACTPOK_41920 [Streptomyces inhibens]|uniref:hypothetical protein n=1 Tax=Streptomyces inhibens TaxID=2293571 RepID=UPI00402ABF66